MSSQPKVTKKQLLRVIKDLESRPDDRVRILGDFGITSVGVGLGAAASGAVAAIAGATSIPVVTTAASWFGITAVAATPVGWVVGAAMAGGALAYGVSRLIRNGGMSEGRKRELLIAYRERLQEMQRREQSQRIAAPDRTRFIISLREMIDADVLSPTNAFRLIEAVEGAMPISQAYQMVSDLLEREVRVASDHNKPPHRRG